MSILISQTGRTCGMTFELDCICVNSNVFDFISLEEKETQFGSSKHLKDINILKYSVT